MTDYRRYKPAPQRGGGKDSAYRAAAAPPADLPYVALAGEFEQALRATVQGRWAAARRHLRALREHNITVQLPKPHRDGGTRP